MLLHEEPSEWFRVFGFKYFKAATYKWKMELMFDEETKGLGFGICEQFLYEK